MKTAYLLAAAAATVACAVPALAQSTYPYTYPPVADPYGQPVPQPYPGQPGYGYSQPGYSTLGYGTPGYGSNDPVSQIVNQLLGNRYNVSDRAAVSQCARVVTADAGRRYSRPAYGQYGQPGQYGHYDYGQQRPYGYGQQAYGNRMRITAITEVKRRNNGLRVRGLLDSGDYRTGGYGQRYGQGYNNYAGGYAMGDLKFRCTVDMRGQVTDLRVDRNDSYRR